MKRWLVSLQVAALTAVLVPMVAIAEGENGGDTTTPAAPESVKLLESTKSTQLYTQFDGGKVSSRLTCAIYSSGWMQVEKAMVVAHDQAAPTTLGLPVLYPKYIGLNKEDVAQIKTLLVEATQADAVKLKKENKSNVQQTVVAFPFAGDEGVAIVTESAELTEVRAGEATEKLQKLVENNCFWFFY